MGTKKINFNVDEALLQEIDTYAAAAGVNRTAFINMAVAIGARALARQLMPEKFVTTDMLQKMKEAGYSMPDDDAPGAMIYAPEVKIGEDY